MQIKEVNLFAKEQLAPEFIAKNPQHCVPTIDDSGFCLWESRGELILSVKPKLLTPFLQLSLSIWSRRKRPEALYYQLTRSNVLSLTSDSISMLALCIREFVLLPWVFLQHHRLAVNDKVLLRVKTKNVICGARKKGFRPPSPRRQTFITARENLKRVLNRWENGLRRHTTKLQLWTISSCERSTIRCKTQLLFDVHP